MDHRTMASGMIKAERLGHKRAEITLQVYAYVQPSMQQAAAAALHAVIHG